MARCPMRCLQFVVSTIEACVDIYRRKVELAWHLLNLTFLCPCPAVSSVGYLRVRLMLWMDRGRDAVRHPDLPSDYFPRSTCQGGLETGGLLPWLGRSRSSSCAWLPAKPSCHTEPFGPVTLRAERAGARPRAATAQGGKRENDGA